MFLSTNKCDGTGDCIKHCPTEAIHLVNGKAFSCITCGACYRSCPNNAIYINRYGGYVVDRAKCNGCGICQYNCPINNIKITEDGVVKGICARCGACVDSCPNDARIDGFTLFKTKQLNYLKSFGVELPEMNTPTIFNNKTASRVSINTNIDDCILCGRCDYYCPTNAINVTIDKSEGICNNCGVCEDVCPTNSIKNGIVNNDTCTKCLKCLKSCPSHAIKFEDFKIDIVKLNQEKNDGTIISCLNCGLCEELVDGDSLVKIDNKLVFDPSKDFNTCDFDDAIEKCPVSILHLNNESVNINGINKDSLLEGYCVLCGNCVNVCNQDARYFTTVKWDGSVSDDCIRCGTCAEVCPHDLITLTKDGILVDLDNCILCETCGIYCPKDAIKTTTLAKKEVLDGFNQIDPKSCIYCKLCYDICPEGAIVDNGDSVSVDEDKCIYCGACYNICTSKAIIFDRSFVNKNQVF